MQITKQNVHTAFQGKHRKRNHLLYAYYRAYFHKDYTASFIAKQIATDLELPITASIVEKIRHRIIKHELLAQSPEDSLPEDSTAPPKGKEKEQRQYDFRNTEDYPQQDAIDQAFEGL